MGSVGQVGINQFTSESRIVAFSQLSINDPDETKYRSIRTVGINQLVQSNSNIRVSPVSNCGFICYSSSIFPFLRLVYYSVAKVQVARPPHEAIACQADAAISRSSRFCLIPTKRSVHACVRTALSQSTINLQRFPARLSRVPRHSAPSSYPLRHSGKRAYPVGEQVTKKKSGSLVNPSANSRRRKTNSRNAAEFKNV